MTDSTYPITEHADHVVLTAQGDVDRSSAGDLELALLAVAEQGRSCEVDLADVEFMDSSGLRALVASQQAFASRGLVLSVANPQTPVLRVLEITDLAKRFGIG